MGNTLKRAPGEMRKPTIIILSLLIFLFLIITIVGYYKKRNLLDNLEITYATITNVSNISGDANAINAGRFFPVYKIEYRYAVDSLIYKDWAIIGSEDFKHGFPVSFNKGSKIAVTYNSKNPFINEIKSKLKLNDDKRELPLLQNIKIKPPEEN